MNKKILLITTPFRPNIGGVETHLDDLIFQGSKKNINFLVLTYQPLITKATGSTIERINGSTIIRIPWVRMNLFLTLEKYPILEFIYLFPGLFLTGFIMLIFFKPQIKIIHAQGLIAGSVGMMLGKIFKLPVIISTHSIYNFPISGLYRKFVKFLLQNCQSVLTLSQQSKNEILNLGISSSKVNVFTYWINQNIFLKGDKQKSRSLLKLSQEKFICLFVGRLVEVKGLKPLLESTIGLNRNIDLVIIGDGPMDAEVRKTAKKNKNIIYLGKIENKELPIYYSSADILIVPSIHEEGFGRVILEALSCGLPVIASNRGGIKESLSEEVGMFIDITPKNIRDVLELISNQREKLRSLSSRSSKFAQKHYGERNAKMIFKYYE